MERDGSGASTLLGLDGFVVQAQLLEEASGEWWYSMSGRSFASWTPCDRSSTFSLSGQRVTARRARSASISGCGTSTVNGRIALAFVVCSDVVTDMVASWSLRAEAPRNSSTAASSNEGEFVTSMTSAAQRDTGGGGSSGSLRRPVGRSSQPQATHPRSNGTRCRMWSLRLGMGGIVPIRDCRVLLRGSSIAVVEGWP
jgi:hypothetical protein